VTPLHLINIRRVAFGMESSAPESSVETAGLTGIDIEAITHKVIEILKNT
jgi:hypothetical protein